MDAAAVAGAGEEEDAEGQAKEAVDAPLPQPPQSQPQPPQSQPIPLWFERLLPCLEAGWMECNMDPGRKLTVCLRKTWEQRHPNKPVPTTLVGDALTVWEAAMRIYEHGGNAYFQRARRQKHRILTEAMYHKVVRIIVCEDLVVHNES